MQGSNIQSPKAKRRRTEEEDGGWEDDDDDFMLTQVWYYQLDSYFFKKFPENEFHTSVRMQLMSNPFIVFLV